LCDTAIMAGEFALTYKGLFGNHDLDRDYYPCQSKLAMAGSSSVPTCSSSSSQNIQSQLG